MYESPLTSSTPAPDCEPVAVDGLIPIVSLEDCELAGLEIPAGWEIGQFDSPTALPILRIALFRPRGDGPWIACETLTAFKFTGGLTRDRVTQRCVETLRGIAAQNVTTTPLEIPTGAGARSNGFFNLSGQRLWVQCSTYTQDHSPIRLGLLVEQLLFVDAENRAWLRDDIDQLTDDVHAAVLDMATSHRCPEKGNPDGS